QAFAVQNLLGLGGSGQFQKRREDVDVDGWDLAGRTGFGDSGPADDEGLASATFVQAALTASQWGVVGDVSGFLHAFPNVAPDTAVVAGEDQHGVVREFELVEDLHDSADAFVDTGNHRSIRWIGVTIDSGLLLEPGNQFR